MTFDQELYATPTTPQNWGVRINGFLKPIASATASGSTVLVNALGGGFPDPGPDTVTYLASPPQVRTLITPNRKAPPFADFPVI